MLIRYLLWIQYDKFKIEYELKDYNLEDEELDSSDIDEDFGVEAGHSKSVIVFAIVFFVIGISIGMYVLMAVMAQMRKRSAVI